MMKDPVFRLSLVLLLLLLVTPVAAQHPAEVPITETPSRGETPPGEMVHAELSLAGASRSYELFTPAGSDGPLPLLVVLHGRGGSGAGMATATGFNELADALVAYPNGLEEQWNYLAGLGGNSGVDDVRFIHELVEQLVAEGSADPGRVYLTGFSNGGFMVQRLACEADSQFSGFASVAGAGFGGMPQLCAQPRPLAMMLVHGTLDRVVPWDGQVGMVGGRQLLLSASVPQTFAFWADFAGCGGASDRRSIPLPGPRPESVEVLRVTDCPAGSEVVLYALKGGDHSWPRLEGADGRAAFDVSREILEFFGIAGAGELD